MKRIFLVLLVMGLQSCGSEESGAARIVIGTSSIIFDLNPLQYQKPYVVQVSGLDGNAAPNTRLSISLKNVSYFRGQYIATGSGYITVGENYNPTTNPNDRPKECAAEDVNNNGSLDSGEDINLSGFLEPTNVAIIDSHPTLIPTIESGLSTIITDESGFAYFALTYPKSESNWTKVEISITASVIGSENIATREVLLSASVEDLTDETISPPGGSASPYNLGIVCP